jgi:type IV pilus assembly protein PilM
MSVGIDIGSKTVKIVELSRHRENWRLRASGVIGHNAKTPEQTNDDKELVPLAKTIRKLYKEARISSRQVVLSLPEPHVFTRTIKFPLLTDAEIASAVKWEAEQYIPIPIKEAIVQHQVVEKIEDTTPPQVAVLLTAVSRVLVEKYTKVLEMAGLKPFAIETELMAAVRSLAPPDQTVLIIDFGAGSTDIAVSKKGVLMFSRSINVAGEAFTRSVAQYLGVSETQAEQYKRAYGLSETQLEGKIKEALERTFATVVNEIKKATHFYQAEERGESLQSIILSGGSSIMPDVALVLTKRLGLEVIVGNPFSSIEVDPIRLLLDLLCGRLKK